MHTKLGTRVSACLMGVATSGSDVTGCGVSIMMTYVGQEMALLQRQGCELAVERYHEPHLNSLQYDIHR